MSLLDLLLGRTSRRTVRGTSGQPSRFTVPHLETLEDRCLLSASGSLLNGTLTITTTRNSINRVELALDGTDLVLTNDNVQSGRFSSAAVNNIVVDAQGLFDTVRILPKILQRRLSTEGRGRIISSLQTRRR